MSDKNITVTKDANGDVLSVTLDYNTYKSLLNPFLNNKKNESFDSAWERGLTSSEFRDKIKERITKW